MPRFFVAGENIDREGGKAFIIGDDARHIARSLRMAVGDGITLSDGEGAEFVCELLRIRDEECEAKILSESRGATEPPSDITLFMAYPKGDKLELIVQKAVELGASKIVPFISERCIKRPQADRQDKQTARLSRIAYEASKQCGRSRIAKVEGPIQYKEVCQKFAEYSLVLFCYEGEGTESIKSVLENCKCPESIAVIVGSEGGFSDSEARSALDAGARLVGLGPRILRCETAPDYCLAALSYAFEM